MDAPDRLKVENYNMNSASSYISSKDPADSLERAIMYMLRAYLGQGLVPKERVINMLEDVIQKMYEPDPVHTGYGNS